MKTADMHPLTERHLLLFGTIVQWFARYELLIHKLMANIIGTDANSIMLLTRSLDFSAKRRALFDLLRRRAIPLDQFDRLNEFFTVPQTLAALRDEIAHSAWVPGPAAGSIQPDWILRTPRSIKPFHGGGLLERDEDGLAYSLNTLEDAVRTLARNYERLSDYLVEIALMGP